MLLFNPVGSFAMCGIAGWLYAAGREPAPETLERMATSIRHRGPDDAGYFKDPGAGLGLAHRRLSIIDLSVASHQPMVDGDSGVVLVFNGEIYNFHTLRQELERLGHKFRSPGDTEVLLRSYLEWGIGCLARLAGMFAFGLWDPRTATLHLARDALGMKPLYIAPMADGVMFASEIKAFLTVPCFVGRVDPYGLQQFLEFGYIFQGSGSSLQGVEKVLPGERLELRGGRICGRHVWFQPPVPPTDDDRDELGHVRELSDLLGRVVGEHLIADVPVGLLLSGGLDSSVIASLAARTGPLTTICMGFDASVLDERAHARRVAAHIGSRHLEVLISPEEVRAEVVSGAWVFDDLYGDWGTITTRLLYRRCHEMGIKAVLVGEGADELFGGYDIFRVSKELGIWGLFRLYQRYSGRRYGRLFGPFLSAMREYSRATGGDAFQMVRLFESRRQLPNHYVMKVDKASMAESVEARAPYLDRRIAELAYRTPRDWLLRGGENKYLLRAVAREQGLLPAAISGREKYGAPLASNWLDDDAAFRDFARTLILRPDSQSERLGLVPAMRDYFDKRRSGYDFPFALSVFRNLAWRLLLLELWSEQYLRPASV